MENIEEYAQESRKLSCLRQDNAVYTEETTLRLELVGQRKEIQNSTQKTVLVALWGVSCDYSYVRVIKPSSVTS